ncbi:MAG: pantoate--beta-alanine ligase [Candidatus Aminicenantales bacterium]
MKVITQIQEMKSYVRELKALGKSVGFVPTMGGLHEGHLSLIRESRKRTDATVVSIFVNPMQFGPNEDFKTYPRNFQQDSVLLENEGVDCLFYPEAEEMYPPGYKTYVEVHGLQDKLCGRSRSGHFRGVCTVVLKFFQIVNPDISFFGQKDAQQSIILKKMVTDLNLDVAIEVLPTVRDADGLALSSRNTYLNSEQKKAALVLTNSLKKVKMLVDQGERRSGLIIQKIREIIEKEPLVRIDYIEIVDPEELNPLPEIKEEALFAVAVFIGKTRLIDNTVIRLKR